MMITIFFRYDDYSSLSHPDADRGVIEVFRKHGLSCTFAVVPAITSLYPWVEGADQHEIPLNAEKMNDLRAAVASGTVDLALHGWRHLANEFTRHPDPSEFRGLSLDEQVEILKRGRDFLADGVGMAPTLFVPPWNSYDTNTVKALELCGFRGISASRYSPRVDRSTRLKFAPMTTELGGLRAAVQAARESGEDGPVVGVMMHPYDFKESGDKRAVISLPEFEAEILWLKGQADVRVASISAVLEPEGEMDRERFLANRPSALENSYPRLIDRVESDLFYRSADGARRQKLRRNSMLLVILAALAALGFGAGWLGAEVVSRWLQPILKLLPVLVLVAMGLLALRALRAGAIYTRGTALMAFLSGVLASLII